MLPSLRSHDEYIKFVKQNLNDDHIPISFRRVTEEQIVSSIYRNTAKKTTSFVREKDSPEPQKTAKG